MSNDERFHIQSDSPAAADMLFWRLAGHEALSRPSAYELWVISENPTLDPADILGRAFDITFDFDDADGSAHQRHFQGHAVRFQRGGETGRYVEYRIQLRSWFWLLRRRGNARVLQDKTVLEVLDAVFDDSPIARFKKTTTDNVIGSHPARRYCVQYQESDYAFASRLLEAEGIYYWFDVHQQPGTMCLSDASSLAQKLPVAATLDFVSAGEARYAQVSRWADLRSLETGKHAGRDRNFKTIRTPVGADIDAADTHELADFEEFEFPGGYFDNDRAEEVVKLRGDELIARRQRHWALSGWPDIAPGLNFSLAGSPDGVSDGDYLIGACTLFVSHPGHEGFARKESAEELLPVWRELLADDPIDPGAADALADWLAPALASDLRGACAFAFTALPASINYRPPRLTPRQRMSGPQSALVVGPQGEELHVDEFGRVKVQFHWDRYGQNDEKSSCWLRVSQPWAGQNWGGYFTPRIGQEVIVDFLDGDPDRPLIMGRVYNDDQPIPYQSPTQSGFKTRSTPGGGPANYNEIMFEDKKGQESLNIHAERNMSTSVEADDSTSVGHDQSETVEHDQTVTVKNDRKMFVKGEETREIDCDQHNTVHQHQHNTVDWQQYNHIGQHQQNIIGAQGQFNQIDGKVETAIGKDEIRTVKGEQHTTVTGNMTYKAKQMTFEAEHVDWKVTGANSYYLTAPDGKVGMMGNKVKVMSATDIELMAVGDINQTSIGANNVVLGPTVCGYIGNKGDVNIGMTRSTFMGLSIDNKIGLAMSNFAGITIDNALALKMGVTAAIDLQIAPFKVNMGSMDLTIPGTGGPEAALAASAIAGLISAFVGVSVGLYDINKVMEMYKNAEAALRTAAAEADKEGLSKLSGRLSKLADVAHYTRIKGMVRLIPGEAVVESVSEAASSAVVPDPATKLAVDSNRPPPPGVLDGTHVPTQAPPAPPPLEPLEPPPPKRDSVPPLPPPPTTEI